MVGKDAGSFMPVSLALAQQFSKYGPGTLRGPWDPLRGSQGENYFHESAEVVFAVFVLILSAGVFQRLYKRYHNRIQKQFWEFSCLLISQAFAKM